MVDVNRWVGGQAVHDQIDRLLEGPLLGLGRDLTFVDRPEGVPRRAAVRTGSSGLEDAEEVVDPVVERERIAFDVEEQITGSGRRQAGQPAVGLQRAVSEPTRRQ